MSRIRIDMDHALKRVYEKPSFRERDFFYGADDRQLQECTNGFFPARLKPWNSVHPVMVMESKFIGFSMCPCSSSPEGKSNYSYIRPASIKNKQIPVPLKTTYLITEHSFPIPDDECFWAFLEYQGNVPEVAILPPNRATGIRL